MEAHLRIEVKFKNIHCESQVPVTLALDKQMQSDYWLIDTMTIIVQY